MTKQSGTLRRRRTDLKESADSFLVHLLISLCTQTLPDCSGLGGSSEGPPPSLPEERTSDGAQPDATRKPLVLWDEDCNKVTPKCL